jgi:hypothetical protein
MVLVIDPRAAIHSLYGEQIDMACLGAMTIRRASHVEPDDQGAWWADLAPVGGPKLGPHPCRSAALDAEQRWLETFLTGASQQIRS